MSATRVSKFKANFSQEFSRRQLLSIGGLGMMGLSLPQLLKAEEASVETGRQPAADACIVIFLNGGPSHLDMWDMKPHAPDGIRSEFKPINTSAPGIQLCEHLPRLAKWMHRATLIRSMNHTVNNSHALAVYTALTGHDKGDTNIIIGQNSDNHPAPGSVLSKLRPPVQNTVPYVALPYKTKEGAKGPPQPGFFAGILGKAYDPMWILKDPNADDFSVPELTLREGVSTARLSGRSQLLSKLASPIADQPTLQAMTRIQQRAFDLLTSPAARRALQISDEPAKNREAYGRNIYGQSVLLARRLIESGTRLVTVSWAPDANATWDTHGGNFKKLKKTLLPQFDAACSSLISDLDQRGMLDRTLVAVLGDFGRTPKINSNDAGRDHWNYCYSIMLAGGGFKGGFVYGASDATGAFPADNPLTPADIFSTLYHQFGIDPRMVLYDRLNRPHRLVTGGKIVRDLLA